MKISFSIILLSALVFIHLPKGLLHHCEEHQHAQDINSSDVKFTADDACFICDFDSNYLGTPIFYTASQFVPVPTGVTICIAKNDTRITEGVKQLRAPPILL